MDPLFPDLPEDLTALSDEDLQALLDEHEEALTKVESDDPTYIGDLTADEVLTGLQAGVEQIKQIRELQAARLEAEEAFNAEKARLVSEARPPEPEVMAEEEAEGEGEEEDKPEDEEEGEKDVEVEVKAEVEAEPVPEPVAEKVLITADASAPPSRQPVYRRPPAPSDERSPAEEDANTPVLIAAAGVEGVRSGIHLDAHTLAQSMINYVSRRSKPTKHQHGVEEKLLIAAAQYKFPEERRLIDGDHAGNVKKIRAIGNPYLGNDGVRSLVASGGLCAPLTPLYDIPDFAVNDRPVRDSLPSFQAERGGISVPSVSTIGDITSAITVIEETADAQGGTFATKSCQDTTCPTWTDVAVGIISHCREYGNMNARAWPEGIAHENALTMAAHARTAEARLLDRIKALSLNVTGGADTLNAWSHVINAIARTTASVRYLLRLGEDVRFRALMPVWMLELLQVDAISNPYDRWMSKQQVKQHLSDYGVQATFYLDTPSSGVTQGFSAETASAIDPFPGSAQIALFPEGTFLHLDGGTLELGIVRDSTLNSTNDYQVFGETFENVARIGPTQAARWLTLDICPVGTFPATGTALACT